MKKLAFSVLAFALLLAASPAHAQQDVDSIQDLGQFIINLINGVAVPVIFALAFVVFIFGIFQYFIAGGSDEEKRTKGKQLMLYGIAGIFIMISVWGLVNILRGTVRLEDQGPDELPQAVENVRVR